MGYQDPTPRHYDSDSNLLFKIAQLLNGILGRVVDPLSLPEDGVVGKVHPLACDLNGCLLVSTLPAPGAPLFAVSQVGLTPSASQALASRATRRKVSVKNLGPVLVYIGHSASVSSTTGYALANGESVVLETTAAVFAIASSDSPKLAFIETYD